MSLLQKFFAKDNATVKLASTLTLAASVLSAVAKLSFLPSWAAFIIPILIAVSVAAAHFFTENKVLKQSSWLLLGYAVVDTITTYLAPYPNSQEILVTLAVVLKTLSSFTVNEPTDPKPPVDTAVQ
ncbi:MAG: hypothetical protein EOO39_02650 [Cytophagaceae bacterium]|nr:MAG: hypothetical protein EOO39_02650 [Cytophagaceae bacterium]